MKKLIIYRLYDPSYGRAGNEGNIKTLAVYLREDNTLSYSLYGGWQDSGTGFSISNLMMRKSLPISITKFTTTKQLHQEIVSALSTGCGSNAIKTFEILNEIKEKKSKITNTKGIRVFVVNQNAISSKKHHTNLTDKEFANDTWADNYSLSEYADMFNTGQIDSENDVIRFIDVSELKK